MKWFFKVLRNYSNFKGRARRKEYWMFMLFYFVFATLACLVDFILMTAIGVFGLAVGLYSLAMIIPAFALSVRRMHDVGKSGWMILVNLIPMIGGIWYFILTVTDSQMGDNKYGPNPKQGEYPWEQQQVAQATTASTVA